MEKEKLYENVRFSPEVIREAYNIVLGLVPEKERMKIRTVRWVKIGKVSWEYGTDEEFFSALREDADEAMFVENLGKCGLVVRVVDGNTRVEITGRSRQEVEAVSEIFEKHVNECRLPERKKQRVSPILFVGHGRSEEWKELKDHLHEKHGYKIEAYEIGARAGHAIRDILEEMLEKSSFGILIMTGEDKDSEGKFHARENVIHELGLFQGRLGFKRAIVLLEEGTEEFSNIHGMNQIRYSKGKIRETYGEVLATLRREFGEE
ncbi:MAG: nucleotide-binding protein [Bacteroidota bacterium]